MEIFYRFIGKIE
ncbi:MAG: hypothetical protein MR459_20680 [Enterocloster aldenensis]|nr:hypothetical protein [Enterocloster aldenensis]MCI5688235.1 hypothetical protein [Emergencia sp.]MCI6854071.1 hypothetical protein [Bacillota bacterium]